MPEARRAAQTAIRLDERLAEAHAALGYVHLVYDWDDRLRSGSSFACWISIPPWRRLG